MAERPILMSAPMVVATLDGSKTQTRRVLKTEPVYDGRFAGKWKLVGKDGREAALCSPMIADLCPYGLPGDQLWVRETWQRAGGETGYWYAATDGQADDGASPVSRWRPSIHMPRAASRISLEVTRVRIERLQDIGPEDAKAEGCHHDDPCDHTRRACAEIGCPGPDYRIGFRNLWEAINGPGSWAANPWVWAIDFKRITP